MQWRYKYIEDPNEAFAESLKHISAMEALFMLPGRRDAALFTRFDVETGGVHHYFTPQAETVAVIFNATPCEKPSRDQLGGLAAGDQTLWARLYP